MNFKVELTGEVFFTNVTLADEDRVLFLFLDVLKLGLYARWYPCRTQKVYVAIKNTLDRQLQKCGYFQCDEAVTDTEPWRKSGK